MFLEKLKLQLFAATNEDDEPDYSEQVDEEIDESDADVDYVDDESIDEDEEDGAEEELNDEEEGETEDAEEELETEESAQTDEKPFIAFKTKEEHQEYMDKVIGKRLGEQRELKKKQDEYDSVMSIFMEHYGVSDFEGLKTKADELLDDIAYSKGTTKDKLKKQQEDLQKIKNFEEQQKQIEQQQFINMFTADCEKLAKSNPSIYDDVKVDVLLEDKEFLRLLGTGVPFKQAYDALNLDKIIAKQTSSAKKKVVDDIKAKGKRISENATKKSKAASIKLDPSKMTDEQLADLEERAANGEKIRF